MDALFEGIPVAEIRRMLDRQAIADCMARYIRGVDRHDAELMAGAFWPDAQINYDPGFTGPPEVFVAWANAGHAARYRAHSHNITNQFIEIDGEVAHVESYVLYFLHEKEGDGLRLGVARYVERYDRRHGEWRIAVREFVIDTGLRASAAGFMEAAFMARAALSAQDRGDISYARPLKARPDGGRALCPTPAKT